MVLAMKIFIRPLSFDPDFTVKYIRYRCSTNFKKIRKKSIKPKRILKSCILIC